MSGRQAVVLIVTVLGFLLAAGCGQGGMGGSSSGGSSGSAAEWLEPTGEGEVVAKIGDTEVYLSDLKDRIEKQSPYIRARYNTLEKKKEFLNNIIRFELLAKEAVNRGLHKDPEVVRSAKQVMTQKLMRTEFDEKAKKMEIPEAELKSYYESHLEDYNKPAMRRASHILIKVEEGADKKSWKLAKKKADDLAKQASSKKGDPNAFRKLAADNSDDPSNKNRGGDLGYFASTAEGGPMVKEFSDAVFAMDKINDISKPVKTKYGYHVIRLTGKRDRIERDFEQVKGQIQHRLTKDKRTKMYEDFIEGLKKKSKITIYDKVLDAYAVPGAKPPIAPGEVTPPAGDPKNKPAANIKLNNIQMKPKGKEAQKAKKP